jgi:hypothetical protein
MNLFFKDPQTILRMREGPLGHYIDSYAAELCAEGYAHGSAVLQIRIVADFSRWLAKSLLNAFLNTEVNSAVVIAVSPGENCFSIDPNDSIF